MNVQSGRDNNNKFKGRWEGSFERDRSYGLSWPQRNYNCNFCKKEFKSAQALGGHMNVHRRDRAKQLAQHSSSSQINAPHLHSNPNPKPKPNHNHNHLEDHHNNNNLFFPHTISSVPAKPPAASTFLITNYVVSDQEDDRLGVSPQIREIRKKLAVEANNKKNFNHFLGLDLNITTTAEDLDLELRLGRF